MDKSLDLRPALSIELIGKLDFVLPLIIKFLFELVYINDYSPVFAYLGETYTPNHEKEVISWIAAAVFCILFKMCSPGKIRTFFSIFVALSIMPSLSIYWLKNENTDAFFLILIYWGIWWCATFLLSRKRSGLQKSVFDTEATEESNFIPDCGNLVTIGLFLFTCASTLYFSAKYGGFRLFIDLNNVYTYRLADNGMSSIEGYIFAWNTNVFLPVLFGIHYNQKKYVLFAVDIILTLMSYGIYGNKSMLFTIPLVFGVIILKELKALDYIDAMISAFIILYLFLSLISSSRMLVALGDRMLQGPAAGHYNYFDFFSDSNNPFLYLRESILRFISAAPYEQPSSVIIGSSSKYYSGAYNNMNNGLFSSAFANFGYAGVCIQPLLIVLTMYGNIFIMRRYDNSIQYLIILVQILYLISTTYFSWLVTGGVILEMVLLYLIEHYDGIQFKFLKSNDTKENTNVRL